MAEIDSLEIKIISESSKANRAIKELSDSLGTLSEKLKFDTTSLERLGKINGNNFKKIGEGLQSFANAARSLQNVNGNNFNKLSEGLSKIASIDSSKLEALGKIDGNSFRGLGEGVKALSAGLKDLKGVSAKKFETLASGIERLGAIQPGSMEAVGNALKPLSDGINVLSSTTFDNANLQNLINSLTRLSNADTGSLSNINFATLGDSIKELSDKLSNAEKVHQNTISMTNAVAKLASAGENANIVTAALPKLGESLKELMENMKDAANLEDSTISFTQALAQLASAGKRAESTAAGLPALGESLKKVFDTMARAPLISAGTIKMTQALAQLASAGGKAGISANSLSNSLKGLQSTSISASGALRGLQSGFAGLVRAIAPFVGIWQLVNFGKKAMEISSSLTEVQNVVDVTFGDMAYKVEDFAQNSIEQFGMSELALKQYSSRFQSMGAAMGINSNLIASANENLAEMTDGYITASDSMADVSLNLTKLTADMASLYNVEQELVAQDLEAIFTGQTRPLRDYGLDLTQATLQEWALKNGLDADIQSMSQAEKTMLRYQYVIANTTAAHNDFSRTADTWANQIRILRQNFEQLAGIIGGVLVNAFKPLVKAVNAAMGYINAFAKTISNALGKIFGWTYEEGGGGLSQDFGDAADAAGDLAGSTGKAAKDIKEMKAGLRAFDELKTISMPTDSDGGGGGGGGGGGAAGADGGTGGKWIPGESIFKNFESEIKTLGELGEYIGDALTKAMDNIPWERVYEKARNFGKGLADFLNGLISPELFGAAGRTIAGALNTAIYAALSFATNFDFKNLGLSIASGINNFFSTFDFAALADSIDAWVQGVWDLLVTTISNIDWGNIWQKAKEFLSNLDLKTVGIVIGAITISKIGKWALGGGLINLAGKAIGMLFSGLGMQIPSLSVFTGNMAALLAPLAPVIALIASAIALVSFALLDVYNKNEEVRKSFEQATNAVKEGMQPVIAFFTETLLPGLASGWERVKEVLSPLSDFLNEVFVSVWQDMINPALTYLGEEVLPRVAATFENLWSNILVPLGTFIANVLEPAVQIFSDILSVLWKNIIVPLGTAIANILGKAFEALVDMFNALVVPAVKDIIDVFNFLWSNILSPIVSFIWSVLKPGFEQVFGFVGELISNFGTALGGVIDFIAGVFTGDWRRIWEGVVNIFKGSFNTLPAIAERVINSVINLINGITGGISEVAGLFGLPSIPKISKISIPRFEQGGFPDSYSIFMAGEHGNAEMLGTVGGRTAVAGGEEITGIRDAILSSAVDERKLLREQNQLLNAILRKEFGITKDQIGRAAREYSKEYFDRTGEGAYVF